MKNLTLTNISKSYQLGNESVPAVKNVSLAFRQNEFVAILGHSGCGKTTLLNVIGGLDQYESGDMQINGVSTRDFKSADWDAYRNHSVGFVFQNYNLIAHQSVLRNVEISLTLSGVSAAERRRRAVEALEAVGLADQLKKKPAQMSGGQMQRAAIARALVNNPDIILADEPTGALDSQTSLQVMEILKETAQSRLVIMVTHNAELAEQYADRIIRMVDGAVRSDSKPFVPQEAAQEESTSKKEKKSKTAMSLRTALSLSARNLLTKKGRTLTTSFAGSIGIIGVALVIALSGGLSAYMREMQSDSLAGFPITISKEAQSIRMGPGGDGNPLRAEEEAGKFPQESVVYRDDAQENTTEHRNLLTQEYLDYVAKLPEALPDAVNTISYIRGVEMNLLAKGGDTALLYSAPQAQTDGAPPEMAAAFGMGGNDWQEMPDNHDFVLSLYDLIGAGSRMPQNKNEILLVVDEYNRLDSSFLEKLGLAQSAELRFDELIGKQLLSAVPNDLYYSKSGALYAAASAADYEALYTNENSIPLYVTGILRAKDGAASSYFSPGLVYTAQLTDFIVKNAQDSEIARAQTEADRDVRMGRAFANENAKNQRLLALGADTTPTGLQIYPKSFESKDKIKEYLDAYNTGKSTENQVIYTDMAETIAAMTGTLLNTVSLVLVGFAAVSLLVSTIMIAVITYVSVIERTKEIGILRAVGARKKDITRVFNAETLIIGLMAGGAGVGLAYALCVPINLVVASLVGLENIAALQPMYAAALVLGSMALTLLAGFIPSRMAAKKDPVEALRTE